MNAKKNKLITFSMVISLTAGIFIFYSIQEETSLPQWLSGIITILSSVAFYQLLIGIFYFVGNHSDFLLKIFWEKTYLKGFWSYTYMLDGQKQYGVWVIDQDIDEINIKGFGLSKNGRRSDVQSISPLIKRGVDYEITNMRRDVNEDGTWSDVYFYSKTNLHLISRKTFLGLFNYPLEMDGTTTVYGGSLSGKNHSSLKFEKHPNVKNEREIEHKIIQTLKEQGD